MKRLIWLPIAGFLLIAGATVAAAAPSLVDSARGLIGTNSPAVSGTITTVETSFVHPGRDLLDQVLADLVADGTLTQAQADAVTSGLESAVEAKRTEMQARMELMRGFVEDGVITQDEIDQLPADDPLRVAFDSIANDGQVTLDELHDLGPRFGPGHPGHGHGFFRGIPGGDEGGLVPDISPNT